MKRPFSLFSLFLMIVSGMILVCLAFVRAITNL